MKKLPLDIPFTKRSYTSMWIILGCFLLAMFVVKPATIESFITSTFVVFPTIWLLVSATPEALDRWQARSRYPFAGWLILCCKIALYIYVTRVVEPFLSTAIGEWLHA